MALKPHSRAWYARLAAETGVYEHPWTQVLTAPSGETLFEVLLERLLTPECHVLEAGCGHGRDAQRWAHRVRSYTGYDFTPAFVARARQNMPQAEFVVWDSSREPVPERLKRRFTLVVSRRGPTSVLMHLLELCAPGAQVLCIHPDDHGSAEERVRGRLAQTGLVVAAQWHVRVGGVLPTWEDFVSYRRFHGDERALEVLHTQWHEVAEAHGFPMEERRYIHLVHLP
jgi:SAM-dependent methyltransferase